jgi:N6-L-threonylcarbamoyladenine synthase
MEQTGLEALVVAGGVGANRRLRTLLNAAAAANGFQVSYPPLEFCTDNGAMIALAGALRIEHGLAPAPQGRGFTVRPRWDLEAVSG